MIELSEVSVEFPGVIPVKALDNIDIDIQKGEWISILGPSGSGKTTLLNVIGGLEVPSVGKVKVNEKNLSMLTSDDLQTFRRETVGFVYQNYRLFNQYSVLENVMLPQWPNQPRKKIESLAKELLNQLHMGNRLNHFPEQLSGGEKQRTAIARALLNQPDILLCDEPTGNLDEENRGNIMDILKQLHEEKGMTIVLVTHDLEVAKYGERELYLHDGRLETAIVSK